MFPELVIAPLAALLEVLLWTGLLFLLFRNLHQSAALTMDTLQDPAPDPVECMEEDIADKVGPRVQAGGRAPTENSQVSGHLGGCRVRVQTTGGDGLAEGQWWCHQG